MRRLIPLLVLLATLARGADTYVVAAGVETYSDDLIAPVPYAASDAKAVAAELGGLNPDPRLVTVLRSDAADLAQRPTRAALLDALAKVKAQAGPQDKLIVFFAGRAAMVGQQACLLTCDSQSNALAATALPMEAVNTALDGLRAGTVLFLLDACRDAALTDDLARGLALRAKAATLLACDVGQCGLEDPDSGHGAFAACLLRGLAGGAAAPDGQIRLNRLADYLRHEVGAWAAGGGKVQTPRLLNPGDGDDEVLASPAEPVVSVSFHDQPLSTVLTTLGQKAGVQFALGQGVDPDQKVTGSLADEPLETVLKVILAVAHLKLQMAGAVFTIERADQGVALPAPPPPPPPPGEAPPPPPVGQTPPTLPSAAAADSTWAYLSRWRAVMPTNMQYRVCPIDGMPQVLIPAGKFIMGDELNGNPNERPRRQVQLSAYWIDLFDVSVAQFQVFCAATGTEAKFQGVGAQPTCPANATWDQAMSYAAWAGRQLPSEAQWEKAARGGLEGKQYPWGDDYDNTKLACHGHGEPVGSYPPNGFGLFDAVGNGPQWCADFYSAKWYETMSLTNPVNLRPDVRYDQPRNRWEARHWIPAEHEEISDQHTTRGGQDWDQDIVQRVACRWPMSSDGLPHFRCVSPCP